MVHVHDPLDAVRRLTRPALAPLRAAAASWHTSTGTSDDATPLADTTGTDGALDRELEELAAMRDQLADAATEASSERAERATRSASAYLEARRARLKRELRELGT